MKRKDQFSEKQAKTYHLGRVCQNCGEPIADQDRATKNTLLSMERRVWRYSRLQEAKTCFKNTTL